jgi:hypothetical protein
MLTKGLKSGRSEANMIRQHFEKHHEYWICIVDYLEFLEALRGEVPVYWRQLGICPTAVDCEEIRGTRKKTFLSRVL